jgi:hypothetical protein
LQNASIFIGGEVVNGGFKPVDIGLENKDDTIRCKATVTAEKSPALKFSAAWRRCKYSTWGAEINGPLNDLLNDSKLGLAYVSHLRNTGLQWGFLFNSSLLKKSIQNQNWTFYFNHKAGSNTVGAKVNYNHAERKWAS